MKLAYRITRDRYSGGASFDELLELFDQYPDCIEEVAIFEQTAVQGYYSLWEVEKMCDSLRGRMAVLREHGIPSVGINVLVTMGHADDSAFMEKPPFQTMVGHDGKVSTNCMCPNSEGFREYTKNKYRMFAELRPDFIWVDDDIRMDNHGIVRFACFCPECMNIFNTTNETLFTREELVRQLNSQEGNHYRKQWVKHNTDTIDRLMALIGQTIHSVDPSIETGLMTIRGTTYSGQDYSRWFTSLKAIRGRPGGGFITDDMPLDFLRKTYSVGRQTAAYPEFVTDIQYELENYPYQRLQKSINMMILECTANLVYGVNGIAFNALQTDRKMNAEIIKRIDMYKGMWREIYKISSSYKNAGLYPAFPSRYDAKRSVENGNWFEYPSRWNDAVCTEILANIGVPLSMEQSNSCGVILSGNTVQGYTEEEIVCMLSGGALIDVKALEILEKRDLAHHCGVKVLNKYDYNVYETYTDDPLNGAYAGIDCNTTGLLEPGRYSYVLEPLSDSVRVLNVLNLGGEQLGPTMTAFKNSLGGRIVVNGYMPWNYLYSQDKIEQMRNTCDWITAGEIPIRINGNVKVVPFIRISEDQEGYLLILTNTSFDDTGEFDIEIRLRNLCTAYLLKEDGSMVRMAFDHIKCENDKITVKIDNISPWQFIIITSG